MEVGLKYYHSCLLDSKDSKQTHLEKKEMYQSINRELHQNGSNDI
jgi:hypothetical protein